MPNEPFSTQYRYIIYSCIPKTAAPRRSSKTENVERSERTGRARETRHPSPPPATAGPHQLRRDWCLAHRLIRWTDPRTILRALACYPVALPVLGANLCCLLRLPVNMTLSDLYFTRPTGSTELVNARISNWKVSLPHPRPLSAVGSFCQAESTLNAGVLKSVRSKAL